jgi:hypothetical protein
MPALMIALLALAVFGLIGIFLIIAMVLEQSTLARTAKTDAIHLVTSGSAPSLYPNHRPRGEAAPRQNQFSKEKFHEHARTG